MDFSEEEWPFIVIIINYYLCCSSSMMSSFGEIQLCFWNAFYSSSKKGLRFEICGSQEVGCDVIAILS